MSKDIGSTFLLKKEDIFDDRFIDDIAFKGFVISQEQTYFKACHPCQGKIPKLWGSWAEAVNDIKENGIKDPVMVKSIITPKGKKYKIVGNSIILGAAILAGLTEFTAIEVSQRR